MLKVKPQCFFVYFQNTPNVDINSEFGLSRKKIKTRSIEIGPVLHHFLLTVKVPDKYLFYFCQTQTPFL